MCRGGCQREAVAESDRSLRLQARSLNHARRPRKIGDKRCTKIIEVTIGPLPTVIAFKPAIDLHEVDPADHRPRVDQSSTRVSAGSWPCSHAKTAQESRQTFTVARGDDLQAAERLNRSHFRHSAHPMDASAARFSPAPPHHPETQSPPDHQDASQPRLGSPSGSLPAPAHQRAQSYLQSMTSADGRVNGSRRPESVDCRLQHSRRPPPLVP